MVGYASKTDNNYLYGREAGRKDFARPLKATLF